MFFICSFFVYKYAFLCKKHRIFYYIPNTPPFICLLFPLSTRSLHQSKFAYGRRTIRSKKFLLLSGCDLQFLTTLSICTAHRPFSVKYLLVRARVLEYISHLTSLSHKKRAETLYMSSTLSVFHNIKLSGWIISLTRTGSAPDAESPYEHPPSHTGVRAAVLPAFQAYS